MFISFAQYLPFYPLLLTLPSSFSLNNLADGLWDVMSNQEVNDMVLQGMDEFDPSHGITWEEGGAYQEAAQMLTHQAYIRGSSDNIGVCVVAMG